MFKAVHVASVVISLTLFLYRGLYVNNPALLSQRRWLKIAPHINDSILLISAIALAVSIEQYPFVDAWLTAKVVALIVYILLGMVALHWGKTPQIRSVAWLAAFIVFLFIISVAILKTPYGFLLFFA